MHRIVRPVLAAAAVLLLGGCAASAAAQPDWSPQPSFQGDGPDQSGGASQAPATPQPNSPFPSSSGTPSPGTSGSNDPAVVATNLTAPTGLVVLPDGTALVGERTTGRIVRVQPQPGQPVQAVRTIGGLSTVGGGGLMDLALSPNYAEDQLIFAYITTPTDNRIVDFTLSGPVTPVLTGIPRGMTDNTGRIAFGPDGNLYIGTGDAGQAAAAADPHSLAGKVLRVTDIGAPAAGNPVAGSAVFASGYPVVDGLCISPTGGQVFETDTRNDVNLLTPAPATRAGVLPSAYSAPGGCAVSQNALFVTSLDGHALLASSISTPKAGVTTLSSFSASLRNKYGRLLTVVAAPDNALWLTTSNKDGHGTPVPTDERVIRIIPSSGGGVAPV